MDCQSCLSDPSAVLVADASIIINLNATGFSQDILDALPNKLLVIDAVSKELENGRCNGNTDADSLHDLVSSGKIKLVKLGPVGLDFFEDLTIGSARDTLDDGEAATIAYCLEHGSIALIDERKAIRICNSRFPDIAVGCTIDLLAHPDINKSLNNEQLIQAVFNALYHGRMRVLPHHTKWVIDTIGADRAAQCNSLPESFRRNLKNTTPLVRAGRNSSEV